MLNSKGKDVVIGTAVFEGYLAGKTSMTIPAAVRHLSDLVYAPSALQSVRATLPYSPCACLCCLCTVKAAWLHGSALLACYWANRKRCGSIQLYIQEHCWAAWQTHAMPECVEQICGSVRAGAGFEPQQMLLREGTFALFFSGQYNTATKKAYEGVVTKGSCASYVQFRNMTHFGMNDYVAPSKTSHQVRSSSCQAGLEWQQYMSNSPSHCTCETLHTSNSREACLV